MTIDQEWYFDDENNVHYYEDGHYWFESRSVDVSQPIEDSPLGEQDQLILYTRGKISSITKRHCLLQLRKCFIYFNCC